MPKTILLTGGAGFIGSHTYVALCDAGFETVLLDNFCNARRDVAERLARLTDQPVALYDGDVTDAKFLDSIFEAHDIAAVVHFAALKSVRESQETPVSYLDNNCGGLIGLLKAMDKAGVRRLVFSSSATIYGVPDETPTPETAPRQFVNTYGLTKVVGEMMLEALVAADPRWEVGVLRYFNPAGAHSSGLIGEEPIGSIENLVPFIARVALGESPSVKVFGSDYPTPDGTGVRDYIHVDDLAEGHVLSLRHLLDGKGGHTVNLGTGCGYSVLEMIEAYARVSGRDIPYDIVARRPGDVPVYCADVTAARRVLGFEAQRDLDEMCRSSWQWQQKMAARA